MTATSGPGRGPRQDAEPRWPGRRRGAPAALPPSRHGRSNAAGGKRLDPHARHLGALPDRRSSACSPCTPPGCSPRRCSRHSPAAADRLPRRRAADARFLAGIVNHDSALIAFTTLALAMLAFMLRSPPRMAHGAWLGGAIVLAALVKGSALALMPVAALAYLLQWLTNRDQRREVLRSAGLAVRTRCFCSLAGGTCARASCTGRPRARRLRSPVRGRRCGARRRVTFGPRELGPEWTGLTYRTYWFHFQPVMGPGPSFGKYVPAWLGRRRRDSDWACSRGVRAAPSCARRACWSASCASCRRGARLLPALPRRRPRAPRGRPRPSTQRRTLPAARVRGRGQSPSWRASAS